MRKLAILAAAAVAIASAACSSPSASPQSGGELRVGLIADIVTLDPAGQFNSPANLTVANAVYDQLLIARDGQGGTSTFTFTNLKENVKLSDDKFTFSIPRGADVVTQS